MSEEPLSPEPQTTKARSGFGPTCLKVAGCGCLVALLLVFLGAWFVDRWIPFIGHDWHFGESRRVQEGQTLDDSTLFFGEDFYVIGDIDGDVTMLGAKLEVEGTIHGDVVFMGERVQMLGTIDGDLRFMGERCQIEGTVTGDVSFTGEDLILATGGVIEGDLNVTGETFVNDGTVGGSISGVWND